MLTRRSFLLTLLAVALTALPSVAQPPPVPKPTFAGVHYGPYARNVLDFWKADSKPPAPVVIFIHGGGFVGGDKSQFNPAVLDAFLRAGISFASINYRYSTQAPYPAPMLDAARAVQFIRSRAADWNLDPKRVACFGGSAGAGISLWLGFHADLAKPGAADPVERQSTRLLCVGSIDGQASYNPLTIREWLGGRTWENPALVTLFGLKSIADFEKPELKPLFDDASAITHLSKDAPPVVMYYDEPDVPLPADAKPGDGIHHPKFGHILKEKMDALGLECVYLHDSPERPQAGIDLFYFLRDHLLGNSKK